MCQGKFQGALPEKYEQSTKKGEKRLCSVFREYCFSQPTRQIPFRSARWLCSLGIRSINKQVLNLHSSLAYILILSVGTEPHSCTHFFKLLTAF